MKDDKTKLLTAAGMLCAAVVVVTMFAAVPIPNVAGAYVNAGDAAVYASAYLLGWPWGAVVAAIGSGLADLFLGSALYAPATAIIKGGMAAIAAALFKKTQGAWRMVAMLLGGLWMTAGYFGYECIIYGVETALISVLPNLIQALLGALLGGIVLRGLDILHKQ